MELDNTRLLILQIALSLVAWSSIAIVLVRPQLARLDDRLVLRWLLAPQMLRHVGMSLLATGVTAGMPDAYASGVATGDVAAMISATVAFWMLGRPGRAGLAAAALATVIGAADLVNNLRAGLAIGAANHLGSAWVVVAMIVPMMLVAHVLAAARLIRRDTWTMPVA